MNVHVWQSGIFILLLPGKGWNSATIRLKSDTHKHFHKYSFSLCREGDV